MAISLSVVMALIIAVVSVITATVCFAPTYVAGVDSVLSSVDNIRTNLVTLASERLSAFFAKPREIALLTQYYSQRGRLDSTNLTAMTQFSCDVALANVGVFTAVTFILMDEDNFLRCDTTNLLTGQFGGLPGVLLMSPDGAFILGYYVDTITHGPQPGAPYFNVSYPKGTPVWLTQPASILLVMNPSINTVWMPPTLAWNSSSIVIATRLSHPDGSFRGMVSLDMSSESITKFLRSLGLRRGGRAIAWDSGTGGTIGLSWGEPVVTLYERWDDLTLPLALRGAMRQPDNFSDPLLRDVLNALGGFAAVQALPLPFATHIGTGRHTNYVDIVPVRDAYGLSVKIMLAMPQRDFLEDVYRQQVRTLAGVCTGVVVMVCLAFGIGNVIAAPLRRLAGRMELTASFDDTEADDPPSSLAEVASMQASYSLMKGQLNRAKTFLPQSVVAVQEEDDEAEESNMVTSARNSTTVSRSLRTSESQRPIDAQTSRSSRSRRRTHVSAHGASVGALNLDLGLHVKHVTVVAFNLRGFNPAALSARRCTEIQEAMLAMLQRVVRENRGVVDYFQGDRVLTSFNAVTNTVAHGRRGIMAAVTVVRELRDQTSFPLQATAGVSQGMALCGNMGTPEMRRFSIVGHVVGQAVVLERLTKLYSGVAVLMPGWMENEAELDLYHQAVDVIDLPGGGQRLNNNERRGPCLLLAPIREKLVAEDEWMYELKSGDDANPFQQVNAGFRALLAGDVGLAKTSLLGRPATADADIVGAAMLAEHIEKAEEGANKTVHPRDLGLYYNAALLDLSVP